jgi:hypothetical protein
MTKNQRNLLYSGTALLVLPFLALCFYNCPLGMHEWDWITNYGQGQNLGYWVEQKSLYFDTMGRFSSTALMGLTHFWYTIERFHWFFVLSLVLFLCSMAYLMHSVFGFADGLNQKLGLPLAAILIWCYFVGISDVYDSIYRFTGVITYQFGIIVSFCFLGLLTKGLHTDKQTGYLHSLVFILTAFFSVGFNEPCLFVNNLVILIVLFFRLHKKKPVPAWLWFGIITLWLGSLVALLAPGNFVRLNAYGPALSSVKLIGMSIGVWLFQLVQWLQHGTLILFSILLIPIIIKYKPSLSTLEMFQSPRLWLFATISAQFLILIPLLWSTRGQSYPERVVDMMHLYLMLGWFGFLISAICRYQIGIKLESCTHQIIGYGLVVLLICLTWFKGLNINRLDKAITQPLSMIQVSSATSQAVLDLVTGTASAYATEMKSQYNALRNCTSDPCYITMPHHQPRLLYDKASDRKHQSGGEPYMGSYFKQGLKLVKYE